MFTGFLRYFLISLVVLSHLIPEYFSYHGKYAIYCFYILAGYFAAFTLNKKYAVIKNGNFKYVINRLIRIYPYYFVAIVLSVFVLLLLPDIVPIIKKDLSFPNTTLKLLNNFFIIGMGSVFIDLNTESRLVLPVWYLSNVLILYSIVLYFGKNIKRSIFLLLLGAIIHVYYISIDASFFVRYFSVYSSILPFSLGVTMYHILTKINLKIPVKYNGPVCQHSFDPIN